MARALTRPQDATAVPNLLLSGWERTLQGFQAIAKGDYGGFRGNPELSKPTDAMVGLKRGLQTATLPGASRKAIGKSVVLAR